ncbi:unnamed protein product [Phytophthora fragariaefolia]|uniref:Unnamed protein product n=1 Tax=Phytophthora fragariaefolia TaxID=1490495 RepID=A0A9W6WKF4_9STRA|nr:unnamed protein product [Phytophthora fragariaefolia]
MDEGHEVRAGRPGEQRRVELVCMPIGARALHSTWVYKIKRDAEGLLERLKARLVACGNEQEFGVNYGITFAAVIEITSVKLILALERKWGVPAKHGYDPNAYVKAEKEAELNIYLRIPQGMVLPRELLEKLGVTNTNELVLELRKALYGVKQAGRLWSKLLHNHRHWLRPEPSGHVLLLQAPSWCSTGGWSLRGRPAGHRHQAGRRGCVRWRARLSFDQGPWESASVPGNAVV